PTTGSKIKDSTSGSSKGTKSQPKSFGKTIQSEEPEFEVGDIDMPQDQEGNLGNDDDDEPWKETASRRDWFTKPTRPQEPTDPDWNSFDELMSNHIDFSAYIMNGLKIFNLTQETLLGLTLRLLKGTRSNYAELEYDFKECYKALSEKLDWENPEGEDCQFDLTKPLPLVKVGNHQKIEGTHLVKARDKDVPVAEGSTKTTTERYMENYKNVSQDIRDQLNAEAEAV
nr:hypothetical protein [Tanacetum cinerariifolium]